MNTIPLAERIASAKTQSMGAQRLRRLMHAIAREPVRSFFRIYPEAYELGKDVDGFFREDFPEDCYRDGEMTYLDAINHITELEAAQLYSSHVSAARQYRACLLDLSLLYGATETLRDKRRGRV